MIDVIHEHIVMTPDVCGGTPRIAGSRIRVQDVMIWHERQGMTVDEIIDEYEPITRADIYAALAYYWDHRDEIEKTIADEHATIAEHRRTHVSRIPEMPNRHRSG